MTVMTATEPGDVTTSDDGAARRPFFAILWLSTLCAFGAHVSETGLDAAAAGAAALIVALAVWVHGIQRFQSWPPAGLTGRRLIVAMLGCYVALAALLTIDASYLFVLFGIFSLTFGFVADAVTARWLSAIVTVIWMVAWIGHGLPLGAVGTPIAVWGVLNVINHFVSQVTAQNEERRRLLEEIDRTRAQLVATERQRGVLAERQRMAGEIHDTLAQGFTSIVLLSEATATRLPSLDTEAVERTLGLIEETARENLATARSLVHALRPPELEEHTLTEAIERLADRHQDETGVDVGVQVEGTDRSLGGAEEVTLLRVAQEALANAKKHAAANRIEIGLVFADDTASITITDDGSGFDIGDGPTEVAGVIGGHGLGGLRDRVANIGGTVEIRSERGAGTVVHAEVPVIAAATTANATMQGSETHDRQ